MPGNIDQAFSFMIGTGRGEFSNIIWPLISDHNDQVHLRALRASNYFRPSVLGDNFQEKIRNLPEKIRSNVLHEIASRSGIEGIELATEAAIEDASAEVKVSVLGALEFRRADRSGIETAAGGFCRHRDRHIGLVERGNADDDPGRRSIARPQGPRRGAPRGVAG